MLGFVGEKLKQETGRGNVGRRPWCCQDSTLISLVSMHGEKGINVRR